MSLQSDLVGKTISGVIARPGSDGREVIVLQFVDGSCFELLSLPAQRLLRRLARSSGHGGQLSFFPQDAEPASGAKRPSLAA